MVQLASPHGGSTSLGLGSSHGMLLSENLQREVRKFLLRMPVDYGVIRDYWYFAYRETCTFHVR